MTQSVSSFVAVPYNTNTSGTLQVTEGTASSFSGNWYIEEQNLSIQYWRVPQGRPVSMDANLSGQTVTSEIVGTFMIAKVQATVTRRKEVGTSYILSAFTQAQNMVINSVSSDASGLTYGPVAAGTLGPRGSIETLTPFYSRVPYVSAVHDELMANGATTHWTSSVDGYTWYGHKKQYWPGGPGVNFAMPADSAEGLSHEAWWIPAGEPHAYAQIGVYNQRRWRNLKELVGIYWTAPQKYAFMPGSYVPAYEKPEFAISFISDLCNDFSTSDTGNGLYDRIHTSYDPGTDGRAIATQYLPWYRLSRHKWGQG